ncbi:prolyl oligopeptidase family serine peptidase [Rhodococcus sp. G-MC3]|uniref:prolyl oligopeptidase family serine peptidase n=1 Tax=Rhodococcus sp. G-MC3 TaxID=3046209 RepID=UPI0024BB9447|nr:prolyl oligopeptidase family serine peptidase [Rhodococcus sp. G-MC3]MDJ0393812.1 prolyl oligopeptidase family serine peptidase [Rhodococcus sp. G-MC3]
MSDVADVSAGMSTFSTPVETDQWWHFKCRTAAGVARWASPRRPDDQGSGEGKVVAESLLARPGARRIGDDSPSDLLGSAVAVAFHPSGDRVAYVSDSSGTEHLRLYVRWIDQPGHDEVFADSVSHSLCWGVGDHADHLYFCKIDDTLRPYAVARTTASGDTKDVLVEHDPERSVRVARCVTGDALVVHSASAVSTHVHAVDDTGTVARFAGPDRSDARWHIDTVFADNGTRRWIALADNGQDGRFRVMTATGVPGDECWTIVYTPKENHIRALHSRGTHALVEEVGPEGERYMFVSADGTAHVVQRTDIWNGRPARYVLDLSSAGDTTSFTVSTPLDPPFVVDVDGAGRARRRTPETSHTYEMTQIGAVAPDGLSVPVTMLRRRGADWGAPCAVEVYGAYGVELGRQFDPTVTQLLDAGIVVAIAHVRGGSERGPGWHALGIGAGKEDSVSDFLACLEEIGRHLWVDPRRVAAWGTSAGGTIVCAAINRAPHLMFAAALDVPFVDPLGTLSDDKAPLALRDRAEWGDPVHDAMVLAAMQRYSPLQNAGPGPHPILRVTAGQHDPRAPLADIERWLDRLGEVDVVRVITESGHTGDRAGTVQWLTELLAKTRDHDATMRRVS